MEKDKIAVISIQTRGGWGTVRKRWENYFSQRTEAEFIFYHIEDFCHSIHSMTVQKARCQTLWYLAAGRAAVKKAINDGCSKILMNTYHYAGMLPLKRGVKYYVYGDASARQVVETEGKRLPWIIDFIYKRATVRMGAWGVNFLGMSQWYLNGLKNSFGVPEKQLFEVPMGINLDLWKKQLVPSVLKNGAKLNILFVGAPFEPKGGLILQEVAKEPEFEDCIFHFVGHQNEFKDSGNCRYYTDLTAESDKLLQVFSLCDLMVMPTLADCSPNVAIEAIAMSLPVVISNIGATSEIVENGVNGYLISYPPDKSKVKRELLKYLEEPEKLAKHAEASRKRARK